MIYYMLLLTLFFFSFNNSELNMSTYRTALILLNRCIVCLTLGIA